MQSEVRVTSSIGSQNQRKGHAFFLISVIKCLNELFWLAACCDVLKGWPVTSPQESPALEWRSVMQQTLRISILEHNLKTNKQTTTTKQVYTHMKEWIYMVLWAETWETHSRVTRVPLGPLIVGGWGRIERVFLAWMRTKTLVLVTEMFI